MKLVTWNIQWGRGCDGRVDLQRIVADARALADFDVLCLQEVSSGHDRLPGCDGSDQFAQLAALLPGFEPVPGVACDVRGAGGRRRLFGNLLLSRVADEGADLLVSGGYGHSRLRELVLGGVTRELLAHMSVPVLLSH